MQYRKVDKIEFRKLSVIHMLAFKDFFLSSLGQRFLNVYYKSNLKSNNCISVCAISSNNEMVGFAIGCNKSKGYHFELLAKNLFGFLIEGIIIVFTRPKAIIRLLKNLKKKGTDVNDKGDYAELLSIAVNPDKKGTGIGKELVSYFEKAVLSKGENRIALTTDLLDNDNVLAFYKSVGYTLLYEFTTYPNRKMVKLIKDLEHN